MKSTRSRDTWLAIITILGCWLIGTAFNFTKAFHIDDPTYVRIAQWIAHHPLQPLSGLIPYNNQLTPIYELNQPALYPYLMALTGSIFSWSELSMHSLMSIFSLLAIVGMYRLSLRHCPARPLLPTALLALSPGFIVNQNTMMDIPQLALWLWFFVAITHDRLPDTRRYLFSALLLSCALLMKYTSLVLAPILLIDILRAKNSKYLLFLAIPAATIAAWSLFNMHDYGGVHLLTRSSSGAGHWDRHLKMVLFTLAILPAICPLISVAILHKCCQPNQPLIKLLWCIAAGVSALWIALVTVCELSGISDELSERLFSVSFTVGGITCAIMLYNEIRERQTTHSTDYAPLLFGCWIVFTVAFIAWFAPFAATRHTLLIVPPTLILLVSAIGADRADASWMPGLSAVMITALLGLLLASADHWYANTYPDQAHQVARFLPRNSKVFYSGPWGWDFYAQRQGFIPIFNVNNAWLPGDYIVSTSTSPQLPDNVTAKEIATMPIKRSHWYQHFASIKMYSSGVCPWFYMSRDIDVISVRQITAVQ
jgi:hypothetical protein